MKMCRKILSGLLSMSLLLSSASSAVYAQEVTQEVIPTAYTEAYSEAEEQETETETEQITEVVTEQMMEAGTESVTEQMTEADTESVTEQMTEVGTESVTETVTEPMTESETEMDTESMAGTDSEMKIRDLQAMIDSLPEVSELEEMNEEEQQEIYDILQNVSDIWDVLTEEEQSRVNGAEKLEALMEWFSSHIMASDDVTEYEASATVRGETTNYDTLKNAMNAVSGQGYTAADQVTVHMLKDVTLSSELKIEFATSVFTLDLGGYTLKTDFAGSALNLWYWEEEAQLTVCNGMIESLNNVQGCAIDNSDSRLVIGNGANLRGGKFGISAKAPSGYNNLSVTVEAGALIDAETSDNVWGILMNGDGTGNITINGGTIVGGRYGIQVNNKTVNVRGGTISGEYGIYLDSGGELNIRGGIISGKHGIYSKGELNISGGSVSGSECAVMAEGMTTVISGTPQLSGTSEDIYLGNFKLDLSNSTIPDDGWTITNYSSTTTSGRLTIPEYAKLFDEYNNEISELAAWRVGKIIDRNGINNITLSNLTPTAGNTMPSTISDEKYSAAITWTPSGTVFDYNTEYTAQITLTAKGEYLISSKLQVKDSTAEQWEVKAAADGKSAVVTKTFAKTRKEKLTVLEQLTDCKLKDYCTSAESAETDLPSFIQYSREQNDEKIEIPITWDCTNYDPAVTRKNTFTWTWKPDSALETIEEQYDLSQEARTGTIEVTNIDPIDVTYTASNDAITYSDPCNYDVSNLFSGLDSSIFSDAQYSLLGETEGTTGEGTLNGTSLSVTKCGVFKIKVTTQATAQYKAGEKIAVLTVEKAASSATAPTAKTDLVYSGSAQALIEAGSASGGTMKYAVKTAGSEAPEAAVQATGSEAPEKSSYSTEIPTGKDAGTYTVWYYVEGDANHNDTVPASLTVQIAEQTKETTASTESESETETDTSNESESETETDTLKEPESETNTEQTKETTALAAQNRSAATGDNTPVAYWISIMAAALLVLCLAGKKRIR